MARRCESESADVLVVVNGDVVHNVTAALVLHVHSTVFADVKVVVVVHLCKLHERSLAHPERQDDKLFLSPDGGDSGDQLKVGGSVEHVGVVAKSVAAANAVRLDAASVVLVGRRLRLLALGRQTSIVDGQRALDRAEVVEHAQALQR